LITKGGTATKQKVKSIASHVPRVAEVAGHGTQSMGCLFEQVVDNRVAAGAMMRIARTCCRHLGLLRPGTGNRLIMGHTISQRADLNENVNIAVVDDTARCESSDEGGDCVGRW
jgi:hypothetical protein